ncbi:hypothetical protein PQR34_47920, partial [Paraburkholderia sediminicola]|uniref:hypothetical protein n=1 Tax=Paraburkholderia sediminicola TaxID=458836 RepID=UPI0038BAE3AB
GLTEAEFDAYIDDMLKYRDKFVAHLDSDETMVPPKLRVARKSVAFLYHYLLAHEEEDHCFHDAPTNASRFYRYFLRHGRRAYAG